MISQVNEMCERKDPEVVVRVDRPSGTIILKRPDKKNALSRFVVQSIQTALEDLHRQNSVRAVILTAAGNSFSAGTDLQEIHESRQSTRAQEQWFEDARQIRDLFETMIRFPKPIIAAVNGPALGTGLGLVVASDIVLGGPSATFWTPEPRRGLVSGVIAPLLAFRIGGGPAANLLLRAQAIDCENAFRIGLVHEITSNDVLWARAHQIAIEISESAAEAIAMTKRVLYEGVGEQLGTLLSSGAAATAAARTTEAAQEGVDAFLEKRKPQWR
jgi:enoyl-CoA hydratase/carnithine racemase